MKWQGRRESDNVEDLRGQGRRAAGGPVMIGGGIGTLVIVLICLFLKIDPTPLLDQQGAGQAQGGAVVPGEEEGPLQESAEEQAAAKFIKVVLADTEDVWQKLFAQHGMEYREPKLVLFRGQVRSACGNASAAMGPFYCPGDEKVYIDLAFFDELKNRFGAQGDFAQAYVIAHEIGHHVQNLLGTSDKVDAARRSLSKEEYNELSVRLELQADFYAGVFTRHAQETKGILEKGDIEEALRCAAAIGDDRLQKQAQGYVVPESFTHGTSEQRARWFRRGVETGDLRQGDTFGADDL